MRYLVYLLLAANLAYFGWNLLQEGRHVSAQRELPPLPAGVKPLLTLQEVQPESAAPVEDGAAGMDALTMTQPPGAGLQLTCRALGPFVENDVMQAVAGRLEALGLEARQRTVEDRKQDGYWVYMPTMERARALEIARQLDERGDRDYYIGKDNFMSLGTFKDIARAEVRLQQVRALGLEAIVEARFVTQDTYWLEFQERGTTARELAEMLGAYPELQLQARACL